jgi:hypothetical protein
VYGNLRQAVAVDRMGNPPARAAAVILDDDDAASRPHTLDESSQHAGGIPDEMKSVRRQHPIEELPAEPR